MLGPDWLNSRNTAKLGLKSEILMLWLSCWCCVVVADKAVESGMSPEYVASRIVEAVCARQSEVMIGPLLYRITVYLRNFLPNVYFSVMRRRAWQESVMYRKTS